MFFNCGKMSIVAAGIVGGMLYLTSCKEAAPQSFTITGTMTEVPDSVKVSVIDMSKGERGELVCDTMVVNNSFVLTGEMANPTMAKLVFKKGNKPFGARSEVNFVLENGDYTVSCDVPFDSLPNSYQPEELVTIKGGKTQDQYTEYFNYIKDKELASRKAGYLHAHKWFETNNDPDTMAKYDLIEKQAKKEYADAQLDFIKAHPDYFVSASLVSSKLVEIYTRTPEELEEMAALVQNCPDTAIVNRVNRRLEWGKNHSLGIKYKDFAMTTVDGDSVMFETVAANGKPTFVDFWASWCGPCRSAIPHVKETAKKYGDRLDIISVSCDEDADAWRKAMAEEKMTWSQYHLEGEQLAAAAQAYMLSSIPRLLIFDKDGVLVCSTNLPKEADAALVKIFGE